MKGYRMIGIVYPKISCSKVVKSIINWTFLGARLKAKITFSMPSDHVIFVINSTLTTATQFYIQIKFWQNKKTRVRVKQEESLFFLHIIYEAIDARGCSQTEIVTE